MSTRQLHRAFISVWHTHDQVVPGWMACGRVWTGVQTAAIGGQVLNRELITRIKRAAASLGALGALGLVVTTLSVAPELTTRQDDASHWRAVARDYLEKDRAPSALQRAGLTLAVNAENGFEIVPRTVNDLRSFETPHFDAARHAARERMCLAEAIYYEARSEPLSGQKAVAEVVLNRVRHRAYPSTVCEVVFQGSHRTTGCQFTFTCDNSRALAPRGRSWERSQRLAEHALLGFADPVTRRATHYHTTAVDPIWNDSLVRTRDIGAHIFYRFPNRSERMLLVAERDPVGRGL